MRAPKPKVVTPDKKEDSWLGVYWRPAASVVYLIICLFDFLFFPLYSMATTSTLREVVMIIKDMPSDSQNIILNMRLAGWEPITLKGGGMFHIAFAAHLATNNLFRVKQGFDRFRSGGSLNSEEPTQYHEEEPENR